jgi:TPR repeat protein
MKRIKLLIISMFAICATVNGAIVQTEDDDCYTKTRNNGIAAFNEGKFEEAMKYFRYALENCDSTPSENDLNNWITLCDVNMKQVLTQSATVADDTAKLARDRQSAQKGVPDKQPVKPSKPSKSSVEQEGFTFADVIEAYRKQSEAAEKSVAKDVSKKATQGSSNDKQSAPKQEQPKQTDKYDAVPSRPLKDDRNSGMGSDRLPPEASQYPLEYGDEYCNQRRYDKAVAAYTIGAERGDAACQYKLGMLYYEGKGVAVNYRKSFALIEQSAYNNNPEAQNRLGYMYENGLGIKADNNAAFMWYERSAEQGDMEGQYNLGRMYQYGKGVGRDTQQALHWYQQSSRQGNRAAREAYLKLMDDE